MGKPPSDFMKSLVEKMRANWLAEFDGLAARPRHDLQAIREQLLAAQEVFDQLRRRANDALGEVDGQLTCIESARQVGEGWADEDWRLSDGRGPKEPQELLAEWGWVNHEAEEVLGMVQSMGRPRACANVECGRRFIASPHMREKRYCSDYCRVKAHRARQKAEVDGAS
jgi:hypothetical protein